MNRFSEASAEGVSQRKPGSERGGAEKKWTSTKLMAIILRYQYLKTDLDQKKKKKISNKKEKSCLLEKCFPVLLRL